VALDCAQVRSNRLGYIPFAYGVTIKDVNDVYVNHESLVINVNHEYRKCNFQSCLVKVATTFYAVPAQHGGPLYPIGGVEI
jgi:hypothetical protein